MIFAVQFYDLTIRKTTRLFHQTSIWIRIEVYICIPTSLHGSYASVGKDWFGGDGKTANLFYSVAWAAVAIEFLLNDQFSQKTLISISA